MKHFDTWYICDGITGRFITPVTNYKAGVAAIETLRKRDPKGSYTLKPKEAV